MFCRSLTLNMWFLSSSVAIIRWVLLSACVTSSQPFHCLESLQNSGSVLWPSDRVVDDLYSLEWTQWSHWWSDWLIDWLIGVVFIVGTAALVIWVPRAQTKTKATFSISFIYRLAAPLGYSSRGNWQDAGCTTSRWYRIGSHTALYS